jgi:hypothetical protein
MTAEIAKSNFREQNKEIVSAAFVDSVYHQGGQLPPFGF